MFKNYNKKKFYANSGSRPDKMQSIFFSNFPTREKKKKIINYVFLKNEK